MNKKILVGITIAIVAIAVGFVGLKTILGDKSTEIPGEEHVENTLNLQEANKSADNSTKSVESASTESGESGP